MKKLFSFLLLGIFSLGSIATVSASDLTDIEDSVFEYVISFFEFRGVVQGYADDTFRPDNPINRAEFLIQRELPAREGGDESLSGIFCCRMAA